MKTVKTGAGTTPFDIVVFEVLHQTYAVVAESVNEVLDALPVTALPDVPSYVDGMLDTGGRFIAQIDLGKRLGLHSEREAGGAYQVVVVRGAEGPVALRVKRILAMAQAIPENVFYFEHADGDGSKLLSAELSWGERTVLLLDHAELVPRELALRLTPRSEHFDKKHVGPLETAKPLQPDEVALLVVTTNQERYGLPLTHVLEIVELSNIVSLPGAPEAILGIVPLRGIPLLILDFAALLGVPAQPDRDGPVVVIEARGCRVGLRLDAVLRIETFFQPAHHEVTDHRGGLGGYFVDHEQSLIGSIDFKNLIDDVLFETMKQYLPQARIEVARAREATRRFLSFTVGPMLCALPIELVHSVAEFRPERVVSGDSLRSAHGYTEMAGQVIPVIDLRTRLGLPIPMNGPTSLVIVRGDHSTWGLVVSYLLRLEEIPVSAIKPVDLSHGSLVGELGRLDDRIVSILALHNLEAPAGAS